MRDSLGGKRKHYSTEHRPYIMKWQGQGLQGIIICSAALHHHLLAKGGSLWLPWLSPIMTYSMYVHIYHVQVELPYVKRYFSRILKPHMELTWMDANGERQKSKHPPQPPNPLQWMPILRIKNLCWANHYSYFFFFILPPLLQWIGTPPFW